MHSRHVLEWITKCYFFLFFYRWVVVMNICSANSAMTQIGMDLVVIIQWIRNGVQHSKLIFLVELQTYVQLIRANRACLRTRKTYQPGMVIIVRTVSHSRFHSVTRSFETSRAEFISGNYKIYCYILIDAQNWYGTYSLHYSSWNTGAWNSYKVNDKAGESL